MGYIPTSTGVLIGQNFEVMTKKIRSRSHNSRPFHAKHLNPKEYAVKWKNWKCELDLIWRARISVEVYEQTRGSEMESKVVSLYLTDK